MDCMITKAELFNIMVKFFKKHTNLLSVFILFTVCILVYFWDIGAYPLMDVDETRYVSIAKHMFLSKDYLTLYLNGEYFFEKPPLYFWSECLSFGLFGKINEFTARFPCALYALLLTFGVYFTGKKIVSIRYGLVSALILATSLEFTMLSRYAILDIVVTSLIGLSVLCGFLTQFTEDKNKKYFWWLFYIFSGLAVLAKGIPGFVIPFGVMFFVTLFNRTFKQCFKPLYMIPGIILFLLIVLPWHIIMLNRYDPLFFNEYIMKHHVSRFLSASEINRARPFYYYIIVLLWGIVPYIFPLIGAIIEKITHWRKVDFSDLPKLSNHKKFFWFNVIAFAFTFLFFTSSTTKLITYILPAYMFLAYIIGYIAIGYICENKFAKSINIASYILGGLFLLVSVVALFTKYFLPTEIYSAILGAKWLVITISFVTSVLILWFTIKKKPMYVWGTYIAFIAIFSAFCSKPFYNIDYSFGQKDLIDFAQQEKALNHDIYVVNNARKYSVLYYGEKANYISTDKKILTISNKIFNSNSKAIIKNKDYKKLSKKYNLELIRKGTKYSLVKFKSVK